MLNRSALPQPPPRQGQIEVTPLVIADLEARSLMGIQKYGTPLMTANGRDALLDAFQEALDLVVYLRQVLYERDGC